uniref:Uncharacterized protein n=1 Tax=Anguilla anguilla TaxID=7936 RepID=A0A0E9VFZ2_ANGAN
MNALMGHLSWTVVLINRH